MGVDELVMNELRKEVVDDVDVTLAMELCGFLGIGDENTISYLRGRVMGDTKRNPAFNWDGLSKEVVNALKVNGYSIKMGERYANGAIPLHIHDTGGSIIKSFKLFHQVMLKEV